MPLESNTVRFVDNFSQGTRGAASAEYPLCVDNFFGNLIVLPSNSCVNVRRGLLFKYIALPVKVHILAIDTKTWLQDFWKY